MKNRPILLICILLILLFGGNMLYGSLYKSVENKQQNTNESNESTKEEQKYEMYDFTLNDLEGNQVTLSDFRGKIVVINFWASWCGYCMVEMPDFNALYEEELKDSEDVVFLTINMTDGQRETQEKARKVMEENEYTFPVLLDTKQEVAYYYGITSLPVTIVIDKEGYLARGVMGMSDRDTVKKMIDEVK